MSLIGVAELIVKIMSAFLKLVPSIPGRLLLVDEPLAGWMIVVASVVVLGEADGVEVGPPGVDDGDGVKVDDDGEGDVLATVPDGLGWGVADGPPDGLAEGVGVGPPGEADGDGDGLPPGWVMVINAGSVPMSTLVPPSFFAAA